MAGDTHIVETSALFGGLMTLMNRTGKDFVAIGLRRPWSYVAGGPVGPGGHSRDVVPRRRTGPL